MKEDIKQLSMILQSLQRELSHFKTRSVETERQMSNTEKDLIREANGCAQKLHDMQDMFGRSFGRLESDLHGLRRKCEEFDHSYCLDKKGIFKQIEAQVGFGFFSAASIFVFTDCLTLSRPVSQLVPDALP